MSFPSVSLPFPSRPYSSTISAASVPSLRGGRNKLSDVRQTPHQKRLADLLPMIERYAFEFQRNVGPAHWVIDVFLDVQVPYDVILSVLERMFYNDEAPFQGRNRKYIADDILYVCSRWYEETSRTVQQPFGGQATVAAVSKLLRLIMENGIDPDKREECATLRQRLEQYLR